MRKIFLLSFLLLFTEIIFPQVDSSLLNQGSKKTIPTIKIIKEEQNTFFSYDLVKILVSVLFGSGLTLFGVYLQNKHQSKIFIKQTANQRDLAQAQITVAHREKWIDSIIEVDKNIAKNLFYIFHISSNLKPLLIRSKNLVSKIEDNKKQYNENQRAWILEEIRKLRSDIETYDRELWVCAKDFHYWLGSLFLYFYKTHNNYNGLKTLSDDLRTSFDNYVNAISSRKILNETDDKLFGDDVESKSNPFLDMLESIINDAREYIENILAKKPV